MFKESLMSLQNIYGFFLERFPDFTEGILPKPWGISLFLLLFLPFLPLWNNKILAKRCRVFSCYVMISIGLVFIGALFQKFPFGGTPRHTVSILPGILVAWVLIIYLVISEISSNKIIRVAVGVVICITLVPAYVKALALPNKSWQSYQEIHKSTGFDKYKTSPGSIVANWRGRSILSWWLLSDEIPRLAYDPNYQIQVHNYGRTRVVQQDGLHGIFKVTNQILEQERQCWIVLSFLGNADESNRICDSLKNAFQKDPHIHLDISQNTSFNNTILIKVNKNIEKD
jgi:hypothetical protein